MTIEEKLQTEVITTEQAIYCLQNIEDADGDKCDDCPYVDVCSEKGIEGRIAQMAINALEENEGLKKEVKYFKTLHKYIDRNVTKVLEDDEKLIKRNEQLQKEITEIELREQTLHVAIEKAREEIDKADEDLDGYDPHALDTYIARVVEILDKYLGEAKDDKSDRNK